MLVSRDVNATVSCSHCASAGPEQASGSGTADQGGRVREARGRRVQAAGTAAWVLRHGRIPGHIQPETGNHRPHRSEDPQRAVRYRTEVDDSSFSFFKWWNFLFWGIFYFYWKVVSKDTNLSHTLSPGCYTFQSICLLTITSREMFYWKYVCVNPEMLQYHEKTFFFISNECVQL